jgi:hypothetical protein
MKLEGNAPSLPEPSLLPVETTERCFFVVMSPAARNPPKITTLT